MDDLSYREFTFTMTIKGATVAESHSISMSPSIDGINEDGWNRMSDEDKMAWLGQCCTKWVMEGMVFSWE